MASDFYIWTQQFQKQSACSYYRISVPMLSLMQQGLAHIYEDVGDGRADSPQAMFHADILHQFSLAGSGILHRMKTVRKLNPSVRNGEELYPPTLIYDIDDNTDFVHPYNTAFAHLGVRGYPDARLLKPGEGLEFLDANGRALTDARGRELGWIDGETFYEGTKFDIARNLHEMKIRHEIIRTAHGMTVTTEPLARYVREVIGQKNVHVFPNTIIPEHYEDIRAIRRDPECVRILWQGSQSHWIDWYPLRDAIKSVAQKYPKAKFVIFGEQFAWITDVIPEEQLERHPWCAYEAYKLKRGLLNIDINLCPLTNNIFNAGKSAIKWYESALFSEATLAAAGPCYSEISDGETGLIYNSPEQFAQKLGTLIEDPALRARLGAGARSWTLANRTPAATVPGLFDFYLATRATHRAALGRPLIKKPTLEAIKKLATPVR